MADKSLLQLPLATTGAGALLYGVQDNQDKAFPASVLQGSEQPVAANLVYAGPPQAPGNYPTFRPLVVGDIPDLGSIYLKSNGGSIVNATINNSNIVGGTISGATGIFDDNKFTIRNPVDTTKQIRFSAANVSAGSIRVFDFPDLSGSVVTTNADQIITNKSLTVKPSASAGATLRIPHGQPPSAPLNGDVWTTNAGMYVQANNATIGPLAAAASSTVTTFNGRQGAVTLTTGDVTSALGYAPYNPGTNAYMSKSGDTATGQIAVNGAAFRTYNWAGVPTNGVVYFGTGDSYLYKEGSSFTFANVEGAYTATLTSGGSIWTAGNFNPDSKLNISGGTINGNLGVTGSITTSGAYNDSVGNLRTGINTAYDTAVSALNTANTANTNAGNANTNANSRVSKSGDVMTGDLIISKGVPTLTMVSGDATRGYRHLANVGSGSDFGYSLQQFNGSGWTSVISYSGGTTGSTSFVGSVSAAGGVTAGGNSSFSAGGVQTNLGTSTLAGYISYHRNDGTRLAYIGWGDGPNLQYSVENGYTGHSFVGNISATGTINAAGGFGPGSDPRLKDEKSLKSVDNAIDKVYNLNVRSGKYHDWYNPDGKERLFVMADDDMASAAPEVFQKEMVDKDGQKYNGWSADQMIALLTKAVQELTDEVRTLKEKMNE